jgi:hypothetical protein
VSLKKVMATTDCVPICLITVNSVTCSEDAVLYKHVELRFARQESDSWNALRKKDQSTLVHQSKSGDEVYI